MVETLKYASISIDEVIASKLRFKANVFNVDARRAKEVLRNCKWEKLKICGDNGLANAYRPNMCTRIYVKKGEGVPMFTPSQFNEIYPKPAKYISKNTKTDLSKWYVKKGQLLISCSGTIGNVTIVTKTLENKLFSQNLIQLNANDKNEIGYIYTFLISKIGQISLKSNLYGAVIQHIDPSHLNNIDIPNPTNEIKEKIHNLIMNSFDLRDESNELIDKAEKLLIDALKLPPLEALKPDYYDKENEIRTFSIGLDSINNRFDASYHNPLTYKIIDYIFDAGASIKIVEDKEISQKIIQAGRFKRNYVESENGTIFLGGKQILELDPSSKKFLSTSIHQSRVDNDLFVRENIIAITRSGTIGKVQIIPKHWENWAMSEHVLRIIPSSDDIAGYLYIWLNTDYGKEFIKRLTYGAVIDEIEAEHLAEVPIPILIDKTLIKEINDLALKANKLRAEAYYKEQEAIKVMNEEVLYATE